MRQKYIGALVPLQILHAACVFQSICVATVTPCAQWCINVWMLFCNWSNQIDVLYRAPSDADCHLYPLLLLVLVDIMCVSKLFKLYFWKLWHFCLELFCKCFIFSMRQDYLGLVSLCISDSGASFLNFTVTQCQCMTVRFIVVQPTAKRIIKSSFV